MQGTFDIKVEDLDLESNQANKGDKTVLKTMVSHSQLASINDYNYDSGKEENNYAEKDAFEMISDA
jgi:hypothetical protein